MPLKTTQVIPIFRIFDVDKAKEFYCGYLGFKVDWEHRFEESTPLYMQVSLGDFVLSGGELPAMALMDAVVRHIPGVLGDDASAVEDSFVNGLLDSPHYTRPEVYEGVAVPPVLMGGNHAEIMKWRRKQQLEATAKKRPDLLDKARSAGQLNKADEQFLASLTSPE